MGRKIVGDRAVPVAARLVGAGAASLLPLFAFLLAGDLCWSLKERAVQELVKVQLREVSQDPLLLNFLFGALPALLAMTVGPPLGAWSDRTRSRLGRRIPFLLVCTPLLSACVAGLAFSQPMADWLLATLAWGPARRSQAVVACLCVFWTLFEMFNLIGNALFVALINDTVPRAVLGRFFGLFRVVSLAVGVAFFYFVFGNTLPAHAPAVLLAIAGIYLGGLLLTCAGVREPAYPPLAAALDRSVLGGLRGLERGETGFYLLLFGALGVATASVLPVNINAYNAIAQFGVQRGGYGQAVAAAYSLSIVLALPLGWLADRVHPLRVGFVALLLYAVAMLAAWQLVRGPASFLAWLVVHGVLAGTFLTGTASLLPVMLPRGHFSELAAFSASLTALLTVATTTTVGVVLEWQGRDFRLIFLGGGLAAACGAVLWYGVMRLHRLRGGARAAAA